MLTQSSNKPELPSSSAESSSERLQLFALWSAVQEALFRKEYVLAAEVLVVLLAVLSGSGFGYLTAVAQAERLDSTIVQALQTEQEEFSVTPSFEGTDLPANIALDPNAVVRQIEDSGVLDAIGVVKDAHHQQVVFYQKQNAVSPWDAPEVITATTNLSDTIVTGIAPDGASIAAIWSQENNAATVTVSTPEQETTFQLPESFIPEKIETVQSLVLVLAREVDANNATLGKALYIFNRTNSSLVRQAYYDKDKGIVATRVVTLKASSFSGVSLEGFGVVTLDLTTNETILQTWLANQTGNNVIPTGQLVGEGNIEGSGGDLVAKQDFSPSGGKATLYQWSAEDTTFSEVADFSIKTEQGEVVLGAGRVGQLKVLVTAMELPEQKLQYTLYYFNPEDSSTTKLPLTAVPAPQNGALLSSVHQEGDINDQRLRLMVYAGQEGSPDPIRYTIQFFIDSQGSLQAVFLPNIQR